MKVKSVIQRAKYVLAGVLALVMLCLLILFCLYSRGDIGMSYDAMRKELYYSNDNSFFDPDGGTACGAGSIGKSMAVFLHYKEDKSEFDSRVYAKRSDTIGWFFRYGGGSVIHANHVAKMTMEDNQEYVLLSMNSMGVSKIEINRGDTVETVELKDGEPFAMVLDHSWEVVIYDVEGNIVKPIEKTI